MAQPNRRKTYLINPRFQWRFIGFMAAVSLPAIFMLFASNILFFRTMEQEALSVGLARDNPYFVKERFGNGNRLCSGSAITMFMANRRFLCASRNQRVANMVNRRT